MQITDDLRVKAALAALIHHLLDTRKFYNKSPFMFAESQVSTLIVKDVLHLDGEFHGVYSMICDTTEDAEDVSMFSCLLIKCRHKIYNNLSCKKKKRST